MLETAIAPEAAARTSCPLRRRALVICNPSAGRMSRRRLGRVLRHLAALGAVVTLKETRRPGDAERLAAGATRAEYDVVVAAGGDGTINEVVNGLAATDLPLAVVPVGTANVLAGEIGLPAGSRALAQTIVAGPVRRVHLGLADGRRFVMMAGIGFDAHVVARVDLRLKRVFGPLTYVAELLWGLFRIPFRRYRVTVDGVPYDAASVVIANGHYYGGRFSCAPDARLDDPHLDVCLFLRSGPWHVLRYAGALVLGRLHRLEDVRVVRATEIVIDGTPDEPVQCDGDVAGHLPITVRAGALTLPLVYGTAS